MAFIGGALFFLQQFAGINGVLYFSSLTFQDVGITNVAFASLVIGITNFAGIAKISFSDELVCIQFFFSLEHVLILVNQGLNRSSLCFILDG